MSRKPYKHGKEKRVRGQFLALPLVVIESPGYRQAGHVARSLLIDIAHQYSGNNNGRLVACALYLKPLGWNSNAVKTRALQELLDCGLLVETRKGGFPNKAAWYAVSWLALDQTEGLDISSSLYRMGDYMRPEPSKKKTAPLVPLRGARSAAVAPAGGTRVAHAAPSGRAIRPGFASVPTPSGGAYLEIPSPLATAGGVGVGRSLATPAGLLEQRMAAM